MASPVPRKSSSPLSSTIVVETKGSGVEKADLKDRKIAMGLEPVRGFERFRSFLATTTNPIALQQAFGNRHYEVQDHLQADRKAKEIPGGDIYEDAKQIVTKEVCQHIGNTLATIYPQKLQRHLAYFNLSNDGRWIPFSDIYNSLRVIGFGRVHSSALATASCAASWWSGSGWKIDMSKAHLMLHPKSHTTLFDQGLSEDEYQDRLRDIVPDGKSISAAQIDARIMEKAEAGGLSSWNTSVKANRGEFRDAFALNSGVMTQEEFDSMYRGQFFFKFLPDQLLAERVAGLNVLAAKTIVARAAAVSAVTGSRESVAADAKSEV
jgi:hypothetical protein